jgi:hypothetical protein
MRALIAIISICFICALIIFGVKPGMNANADTAENSVELNVSDEAGSEAGSANNTQGILNSIANFEKIYNDALTEPFIKAESKISDPDIAEYYHGLMEKTGLTNGGS